VSSNTWKFSDIEDLHKSAIEHKYCPYYANRIRAKRHDVDLILMPYNYLADETIRKATGIDFSNSIIIFDEGHNIP
jgi:regulator of telomere elongation helicase 1